MSVLHGGLANEQVIDGQCWRCGSVVEEKELGNGFQNHQLRATVCWMILFCWMKRPERVKTMQQNWIGRSEGALVEFPLVPRTDGRPDAVKHVACFTTRLDTIFGCTYMVVAPEFPELPGLILGLPEAEAVREFIAAARKIDATERAAEAREKSGVFTGRYVTNPFTGQPVPLWVGDYVLMGYGTNAVMAVPAHDTRLGFCRKI